MDAVLVAIPDQLHCDIVIEALRAGKNMFCEKPLALNLNDCKKMILEAEKNGRMKIYKSIKRETNYVF